MSAAKHTQDHDTIRGWIEARGGRPAIVKGTENEGEGAGLLRVKFDQEEDALEEADWDEFFDTFDDKDLTFLYQEEIDGKKSRFFKFVNE